MKNYIKLRYFRFGSLKQASVIKMAILLLVASLFQVQAYASNLNNSLNSEIEVIIPQQTISGVVTDENGAPLPGVNVLVEGTINGVSTGFDGEYSIKAPKGAVLIFSYLGMITQKATIGDNATINIVLKEDAAQLDEVVVVGYGTKKKINLSGAVSVVGEDLFESRPVTNTGQALQGAVANLNISMTASPNAVPDFNIRGITSIEADGDIIAASPLFIIDGISATAEDFGRMNANDVESISVLKDAAAASIYGSRASFGVVLVTTKRGKSDVMSVSVGVNTRIQTLGRTPEFELDPYISLSFQNEMAKPWYNLFNPEQLEYARQVSLGNAAPTRISPTNPNSYEYYHSTDWRKEILNSASFSTSSNVSISQRLDKGSYYFSVEAQKNSGIYKYNNDVQERYNIRLKSDYDITDWLNIKNSTWVYNNEYDESNATGSSFMRNVISTWTARPIYNPDGSYTSDGADLVGELLGSNYTTNSLNAQTSFALTAKFFDDKLTVVGDATYKKLFTDRDAYATPVPYSNGPGHKAFQGPSQAWAYFRNWKEEWNTYNFYATFNETFKEKHNLTVLAGYNQEEYFYKHTRGDRSALISPSLPSVSLATGDQTVENQNESWATQGLFGRINYIFDDKYILELNGRYDGSSRYYKDDRWAFNPSGSLAWVVSKENFLKDSFVDLFKLRASYGSLGNQNAGAYATYPFLVSKDDDRNADALIGGANIVQLQSPNLIAPSFTWETIQTKNAGIDLAFLNNRLSTSFDYYHRLTLGMFAPGLELPSVLGTDEPEENATDMITKGWEFNLRWKDQLKVGGKPFNYAVSFNLGDSRSFVTKFPNPTGSLGQFYKDKEIGEIWGFETDGYFQTQEEIDFGPDQTDVSSYPSTRPVEPGDVKFKDLNGDGKIGFGNNTLDDPGDRKRIGNSLPRYNFGLNLSADWNGFDFRAFIQGVGKRDYYPNSNNARYYFWSAFSFPWSAVTKENINNHWTPTNRDAFYPRAKAYVAENAGRPGGGRAEVSLTQTRWLQDASYARLKNVTLGYTIPSDVTEKIGINKLRLYVSGENLFEITNLFKYLDPENLQGDGYPFRRTFSLGATLNF
ncbi:SusC/RagA family TonB-linked outer membrane protein [Flavivirga spongiicola]|uniref:TonB-dependent receptor n=1 Tax=Flavivirga spongiicola TaxID=421621 RepID=A0ABU7XPS4_9FLAO|nr:TonB-dependent receptor [Flavivirga sp. MEBiC05379]MDO5977443.1 TonB-dependent receptor [Flavivirga sp. MEBiC05379]